MPRSHSRSESTSNASTEEESTSKSNNIRDYLRELQARHPKLFLISSIGAFVVLCIVIFTVIIVVQSFTRKDATSTTVNPVVSTPASKQSRISTPAPKQSKISDIQMKQLFLDHINYVRHVSKVMGLPLVEWDDRIYKAAKKRVKSCNASLSPEDEQLIQIGSAKWKMGVLFNVWYWHKDEVWSAPWYWYDYSRRNGIPLDCTGKHDNSECREMHQILWPKTNVVGCATTSDCPDHPVFTLCYFFEHISRGNRKPTVGDKSCTVCPWEYEKCHEGLCATEGQCQKSNLSCSDSSIATDHRVLILPRFFENKDHILARVVKDIKIPKYHGY